MNSAELNELERDVESARARVAGDLARLQSPATLSEFKNELWEEARRSKDRLVDETTDIAKETAQRVFSDIRDRAAANPAAALAIGAGLAWQLLRRPPIASLLVGAGLVGLMKTAPVRNGSFATGLATQANDVASSVKERVQEWSAEARSSTRHTASQVADNVVSFAKRASEVAADAGDAARETVAQVTSSATSAGHRASDMISDAMPDKDVRDQFLLGAATLAIAAAVGIASQRRS